MATLMADQPQRHSEDRSQQDLMTSIPPNWPDAQTRVQVPVPASAVTEVRRVSSRINRENAPALGNGTDRPVTFWAVLDAFRRRWIPTLAVAIPAAMLVSSLLWNMIPARYESTALLRLNQHEQKLLKSGTEQFEDFRVWRDSQINFMKTDPVLRAAIRVDGVSETPTLRNQPHPVEYLREELEVESDFSPEFISITLAGEHPEIGPNRKCGEGRLSG
ncbi:MAG: hypothetical protein R3C49_02565 [Planctomycetaceae bacterium]